MQKCRITSENDTRLKLIAKEKQDNRRFFQKCLLTVHLTLFHAVILGIYLRRDIPVTDVKDSNTRSTK